MLSILTVGSTAATIYEITSKAYGFLKLLNESGSQEALRSLIVPGILAIVSLILSIAYISSSGKRRKAGIEEDTKASRAAGFFGRLVDTVIKACIALFIVAVIGFVIYGIIMYKEYSERPVVDVRDYVDLTDAISGYEGRAVFDGSKVIYTLPEDVTYIYEKEWANHYDNGGDYTDEQREWSRFISNLHYDFSVPEGGLSNDDEITVKATYSGTDIADIKTATHIRIEGLDDPKVLRIGDIEELPVRFESADEAAAAKGDVIRAVEERLRGEAIGAGYTDYQSDWRFFRPKYNIDNECDALVVVASATYNGQIGSWTEYRACYIYPFDSRVTTDIVSRDGRGEDDDEIRFIITPYTKDGTGLMSGFVTGSSFGSNTEHEPLEIDQRTEG